MQYGTQNGRCLQTSDDGGDYFLCDVAVQHNRSMEARSDVGIQPRLSTTLARAIDNAERTQQMMSVEVETLVYLVDSSAQVELEFDEKCVGEHIERVDAEAQSQVSTVYKVERSCKRPIFNISFAEIVRR